MGLAFSVAMVQLGDRSLWGDEAFSVARLWVLLSDPANETQPAKREAREAILAAIGSTAGQVEQRSFAGLEVRLFEPPPRPA